MHEFPLQLRYLSEPVADADAVLIIGSDVRAWLDELKRSGLAPTEYELYVVPHSIRDRNPYGLFIRFGPSEPAESLRGQPYRHVGGGLHIPTNAALEPVVEPTELEEVLAGELLLLHPTVGLVGFHTDDRLKAEQLLARPPVADTRWNRARSGRGTRPPLRHVQPSEQPRVQDILDEGRDDIGTEAERELPSTETESGGVLGGVRDWSARQMARFVHWVTSKVPSTAKEETWVDRLHTWSRRLLAGHARFRKQRKKELDRLLNLLETDPEEGLKFAVPVREGTWRGYAPPSDHLRTRDVDFDVDAIDDCGRADPWVVSEETRQALIHHYRRAANRELRLGRHRRAAYILAQLLGDLHGAAAVLRQGKHYRDAAAIYQDHLNRPLQAAECFEEGGHIRDAVRLYKAEGQELKAADLLADNGSKKEAEDLYRKAVDRRLRDEKLCEAAEILDARLREPNEALDVLEQGWPHSQRALDCLSMRFRILGQHGRHEEARTTARNLATVPPPVGRWPDYVRTLSTIARQYPDRTVREDLSDRARVSIGQRLPDAGPEEAESLLGTLPELAPDDRLLKRDAERYRSHEAARPRRASGPGGWHRIGGFSLADETTWGAFLPVHEGSGFVAIGHDGGPVVHRCDWTGRQRQQLSWDRKVAWAPAVATALVGRHLYVTLIGGPSLKLTRTFHETSDFPSLLVGEPGWLPNGLLAMGTGRSGLVVCLHGKQDRLLLSFYNASGELLRSRELPLPGKRMDPADLLLTLGVPSLVVRPGLAPSVEVALGRWHMQVRDDRNRVWTQLLDAPIRSMKPMAGGGFLALTEEGGMVVSAEGRICRFAEDLPKPAACVLPGGRLVVLAKEEGRIYEWTGEAVRHLRTVETPAQQPIDCHVVGPSRIGLFTEDGRLHIYNL